MAGACLSLSCCLCRCTLEGAKGGGRHKKLKGNKCTNERTIWERFALECDCFNTVQQAFSINSAILCYSCIGMANKFGKMQHQLSQLKEEMANVLGRCNLECAHPRSSVEALTPQKVKRSKGPARPSKRARASVRQLCVFAIEYVASVSNIFHVGYC